MKLYNTLKRKKEKFIEINKNKVLFYVCGPTVYDYLHIGNARPCVVFDALRRYFEYKNFEVIYVQNFTDIDDKIINRAERDKTSARELAEKFIREALIDMKGLNIKESIYPRATQVIDVIIDFIRKLLRKNFAYEVNGTVYFDTEKSFSYGKLSGKNIKDLLESNRIDFDKNKKCQYDFVLWKPYKLGEPKWESPWGYGRPGWHIECSAMAKKYLGDMIDIHAGGEDLIFPHHENEIAQSEACNEKIFANYWLHNGFVNINNQKMSKSDGNYFTIREIANSFSYEILRFFILSVHYRSPMNFSEENLNHAKNSLERINTCVLNISFAIKNMRDENTQEVNQEIINICDKYLIKFIEHLEDDFNTAGAIGIIFELVRFINLNINTQKQNAIYMRDIILKLCGILGLKFNLIKQDLENNTERLIKQREEAKKQKNWELADQIRNELFTAGIILEDTPNGTRRVYKNKK